MMTSSPPAPPGTNDQLSPIRSSRPSKTKQATVSGDLLDDFTSALLPDRAETVGICSKPSMVPLEGFEHVLSILHSDLNRHNPRNYAEFFDAADIIRRPKTANGKPNAGKKRPRITSTGGVLRRMPKVNAATNEFALWIISRF